MTGDTRVQPPKRRNSSATDINVSAGVLPPVELATRDVQALVQTLMRSHDKKAKKNAVAELYQMSAMPQHAASIVQASGLEPLRKMLLEHSNTLNLLAASTLTNIAVADDAHRIAINKSGAVCVGCGRPP